MTQFLAKAGLAALIAIGSLAVTAPIASADVVIDFNGGTVYNKRHHDRHHDRDRDTDRAFGRGCSPRMAEAIARDYGMRRAQVTAVTPRRVIVEGRVRGYPDRMVFANVRGCPVLR